MAFIKLGRCRFCGRASRTPPRRGPVARATCSTSSKAEGELPLPFGRHYFEAVGWLTTNTMHLGSRPQRSEDVVFPGYGGHYSELRKVVLA